MSFILKCRKGFSAEFFLENDQEHFVYLEVYKGGRAMVLTTREGQAEFPLGMLKKLT